MEDQADEAVSVEERMVALLEAEDDAPEATDANEAEAEPETEESEQEEPAEPVTLKLKRGDEEIEVAYDEAVELAQKGYDYTKKTQELADQRKQTDMYAQAIKAQEQAVRQQAEIQAALVNEFGRAQALYEQIAQYENVDWARLSDSDPVETQKHWIGYQTLQTKFSQAQAQLQQKQSALLQQRQQQDAIRLEQAKVELLRMMPDFNAEKAQALKASAKEYGYTEADIAQITDPRLVRVLADAAAYRKLQSDRAETTKKVSGKPAVVKPGTRDTKTTAKAKDAQAYEKLRKTGDQHVAAALIERML